MDVCGFILVCNIVVCALLLLIAIWFVVDCLVICGSMGCCVA